MRIKVKVHSHDKALPEHDQVHFNTEHAGGLMVLRLPKGHELPPIGKEYNVDFNSLAAEDTPISDPVPTGTDRSDPNLGDAGDAGDGAGSDQGGA